MRGPDPALATFQVNLAEMHRILEAASRNAEVVGWNLTKVGGLPLACAQLMSMTRLDVLARSVNYHRKGTSAASKSDTLLDILGGDYNDTLGFG